jgi:hypothetical protein
VPTLPLFVKQVGSDLIGTDPHTGALVRAPRDQLRCSTALSGSNHLFDAILDTGAPLTIFPEEVWQHFVRGADYELLPLPVGTPQARVAGWQFAFHLARFLVPLVLIDAGLSVAVPRAHVVAQFALGPRANQVSTPPVLIGLWGGLLEGAHLGIDRDPHTGRARGDLNVP